MHIFILVASLIFGTLIGSFLNVLILRLPNEQSIGGRSHCMKCKTVLRARHLVPIFSYLALRGKCANCGTAISPRYMLIELITGLLFAFIAFSFSLHSILDGVILVRALFIAAVLLVVFVVDLEHYLILDKIVFPSLAVVFIFNIAIDILTHNHPLAFSSFTLGGIVGAIIAGGFFWLVWRLSHGRWMGYGDVKLGLLLGFILGWPVITMGLFLSFLIGTVVAIPLLLLGRKQMGSAVPFGVFLSAASIIALVYGHHLVSWYLGLIGLR